MANLHFFYGADEESKNAKLLRDYNDFLQKDHSGVWVIKPQSNEKPDAKIVSPLGEECPAEIMENIKWRDIIGRHEFFSDVILVDDVHMFTPKDIDNLVKLSDTYQRLIFCYGFMTNRFEKTYPSSNRLVAVGAKLHEIPCMCQMIGCYNLADHRVLCHRLGYMIHDKNPIHIDAKDMYYKSICRTCYNREFKRQR